MRRPPIDPEIEAAVELVYATGMRRTVEPDEIQVWRREIAELGSSDQTAAYEHLEREDVEVPSFDGATLVVSVFRKRGSSGLRPLIFNIHGGGMIVGDRFLDLALALRYVEIHDVVVASVEYRLAPDHPDPIPVEDCYAALRWVVDSAEPLSINPDRTVLLGSSAGGGLAAGVALLARDRTGPAVKAAMLISPMLDDRDNTLSTRQFDGLLGSWNAANNRTAWNALLGDRAGGADVSIYAAPGRATDLHGFPPAFLDTGSAEVFRDEVVAFASQLWADGCDAELHVWPGGAHGWDALVPESAMAGSARGARDAWMARILARG